MKKTKVLAMALSLTLFAAPVLAQGGNAPVKTNSKITYHNGPVMQGHSNVLTIFYGNWNHSPGNDLETAELVQFFISFLNTTSYFRINAGYPDAIGNGPSGLLLLSGVGTDSYSQGTSLDPSSIQAIVRDQIQGGVLPLDGAGIYVVLASADVDASAAGFCVPNAPPHHGVFLFNGAQVKYAFIGNPLRCPSLAAPQLGPLTPNDNFALDGIANNLVAVLSAVVTNPTGNGWFDRYGFENSTKCANTFGETYTAPNGARANIQVGPRHWLLQQNWVNSSRKGFCAMAPPQP